jgi:hypothetical protein
MARMIANMIIAKEAQNIGNTSDYGTLPSLPNAVAAP